MTFASEAICLFSFFFPASLFGVVASNDVDFYVFYFYHENAGVDVVLYWMIDGSQASMNMKYPSKYQHSIKQKS